MKDLKIHKNLIYLRRKRGITQEALAEFLGVTKASVSKWETGQSLPDILLLPRIASYFDISIDELMGYQAQLSPDEIRKQYHRFAADFGVRDFHEVLQESRDFAREYYSCYLALLQVVVLWINHYMLAGSEKEQKEILSEAVDLCRHIEDQCADMRICQDASALQALAFLVMGEPKEVITILEPQHDPKRLSGQSEEVLIQAYQMTGESKKARSFNQFMIYRHLITLVNDSVTYLACNMQNREAAEETMERIGKVIQIYRLDELHPNTALLFYLQQAVAQCMYGRQEEAVASLKKYFKTGEPFIRNGCSLHGDDYFDQIDVYFEDLDLGTQPPRSGQMIWDSFLQVLEIPAFLPLKENREFRQLKKQMQETVEQNRKRPRK